MSLTKHSELPISLGSSSKTGSSIGNNTNGTVLEGWFSVRFGGFVALHIVIDGYNVIGSDQGLRGDLEAKRYALLQELKQYQARKGYPVTVVFDGWRAGRIEQMEHQIGNVNVLFSRYGEKADLVIHRIAREMGAGCVVVTSDRELRRSIEACGAVAIYVNEFVRKLRQRDRDESGEGLDDMEIDSAPPQRGPKKGNPRKISKIERLRRERLKKL